MSQVSKEHLEQVEMSKKIWNRMAAEYAAMSKLLKHHPNGPLFKILQILEEESFHVFDPLQQHNLPNQIFDLYSQEKRYAFIRLPAPIYQEFINKAIINDEFKDFLLYNSQETIRRKHLLINLQDRTSWKEHARCAALEELQKISEFKKAIHVVTLAIDTDFYHQLSPYHQVNHAQLFKEQFKELLLDEHAGYYFPPEINKNAFALFIDQAFEAIHRVFFNSKNVLLREHRLDFIEIFYLLLQLKLIEWIQPDSVSLTCKDGIDIGPAYSAEIFAFLKHINNLDWTEADWEHLNFMIYAPALLIRERIMLPERFNRMVSALKSVESAKHEFGAENFVKVFQEGFLRIFNTPILHSQILLPR